MSLREAAEALRPRDDGSATWREVAAGLRGAAAAHERAVAALAWTGPGAAGYRGVAASYRTALEDAADRAEALARGIAEDTAAGREHADRALAAAEAALADAALAEGVSAALAEATGGASVAAAVAWYGRRAEEVLVLAAGALAEEGRARRSAAERVAREGDADRLRAVEHAEVSGLLAAQADFVRAGAGRLTRGHHGEDGP